MILYHGSSVAVETPNLLFSRDNTDFGKGFYTTSIKEQAIGWTEKFKEKFGKGIVSVYEFDEIAAEKNAKIKQFKGYTAKWLDFVSESRRGNAPSGFDIIVGCVADDNVYGTLKMYWDEYMPKAATIKRLKFFKPNIQYSFRTQTAIDNYLVFKEGFEI
jgi:hypothetical protein